MNADDYFYSRYPTVEKQIAKAGVRLAIILNHIFEAGTSYRKNSLPLQPE
jgi:S1/P1 Nuclease